ncbi:MAG: hypothetical protein JWN26_852 [Candidatus Saccharibacteria bacterium]|nr:hypothetical protein [Candidatus Saccharibacteria bacterium]
MHPIEQERNTRLNQIKKQLIRDPDAYIESVGQLDAHNLVDVVDHPEIGAAVLRLILGASTHIPERGLSYADSVFRVARHIPTAQIQIVHANHLGNKVNGVNLAESGREAYNLGHKIDRHLRKFPELEGRVLHAVDTPHDTDQYVDTVIAALDTDPELAAKLQAKGSKHGGDTFRYVAAHYAFQDTDSLELAAVKSGAPDQVRADTLISIGCQQERQFYRARMAMQALLPPEVRTAQLFTKHVTPPYYLAVDGDRVHLTMGWEAIETNPTALRDMDHFLTVNPEYTFGR